MKTKKTGDQKFELWPTVSMDRVEVVWKGELENDSRWTMTVVDLAGRIIEQNHPNRLPYKLSFRYLFCSSWEFGEGIPDDEDD